MTRISALFPDQNYMYEVRRRLLEFMLAAFHRSPDLIPLLKKPIIDRLGNAYDSTEKTELALQLCWAVGEYGGGGPTHKDAARELFESLELLLYENLSSSRLGLRQEAAVNSNRKSFSKSSQSRLLCFVITAITKLATHHRELLPRARVALIKVARSRISDSKALSTGMKEATKWSHISRFTFSANRKVHPSMIFHYQMFFQEDHKAT
ncbi:hypothetical protein V6Z11_A04G024500 [Gossypium hirsutum]